MKQQTALNEYKKKQAEIKKLLRQIEAGLDQHDRKASGQGDHHWGHVGDLTYIEERLAEARDFLMGKGEYQQADTHTVCNRRGRTVKVVVP